MQTQFEIYQWLVPVISVFYLARTIIQLAQNKRSLYSGLLWVLFWITIAVLAIIPNPVSFKIATLMGFKSNINAIIFVALGWLFLLVFYLSSAMDRLDRQMTSLVRNIAITDSEKMLSHHHFVKQDKTADRFSSKKNIAANSRRKYRASLVYRKTTANRVLRRRK